MLLPRWLRPGAPFALGRPRFGPFPWLVSATAYGGPYAVDAACGQNHALAIAPRGEPPTTELCDRWSIGEGQPSLRVNRASNFCTSENSPTRDEGVYRDVTLRDTPAARRLG